MVLCRFKKLNLTEKIYMYMLNILYDVMIVLCGFKKLNLTEKI